MHSLPTLNAQPIEKQARGDGLSLEVQEIFDTVQGEGPFAGTPAIFIRLAGCNLQCPLCDTDYTSKRMRITLERIAREVNHAEGDRVRSLVVLTGGEPLRQPLGPLVTMLRTSGFQVQIETNGTLFDESLNGADGRHLFSEIMVVCSPKTVKTNPHLHPYITAYKYVVEDGKVDPEDGLPMSVLGNGNRVARPHPGFKGKVYVQPCDSKDPQVNEANTRLALKVCQQFGYTLCLQLHKILGLP